MQKHLKKLILVVVIFVIGFYIVNKNKATNTTETVKEHALDSNIDTSKTNKTEDSNYSNTESSTTLSNNTEQKPSAKIKTSTTSNTLATLEKYQYDPTDDTVSSEEQEEKLNNILQDVLIKRKSNDLDLEEKHLIKFINLAYTLSAIDPSDQALDLMADLYSQEEKRIEDIFNQEDYKADHEMQNFYNSIKEYSKGSSQD